VQEIAQRVVESHGWELVEVELQLGRGAALVRVFLDREGGIGIEDLKRASDEIAVILDAEDPIDSAYQLEVSSPGLDRPLRNEGDYRRFAGRRIQLSSYEPIEGRRHWQGILRGIADGQVRVELDREGGLSAAIPLSKVAHARLVVEFPSSPKKKGH
jgi:ribosome maturation factor RimP